MGGRRDRLLILREEGFPSRGKNGHEAFIARLGGGPAFRGKLNLTDLKKGQKSKRAEGKGRGPRPVAVLADAGGKKENHMPHLSQQQGGKRLCMFVATEKTGWFM